MGKDLLVLAFALDPAGHRKIISQWPKIVSDARKAGVTIGPDGSFSGRAVGRVTIASDELRVVIESKPWWVPLGAIRAELRALFA